MLRDQGAGPINVLPARRETVGKRECPNQPLWSRGALTGTRGSRVGSLEYNPGLPRGALGCLRSGRRKSRIFNSSWSHFCSVLTTLKGRMFQQECAVKGALGRPNRRFFFRTIGMWNETLQVKVSKFWPNWNHATLVGTWTHVPGLKPRWKPDWDFNLQAETWTWLLLNWDHTFDVYCRKNSVRDKVRGKKWIYLAKKTLHRQSVPSQKAKHARIWYG